MNNDTMTGCGQGCCGGNCGICSGCGGALELTQGEIELLRRFAQVPFLPVARQPGSETPVCLEEGLSSIGALGAVIAALSQQRLIRLDYAMPLSNFDYKGYEPGLLRGSMALTARGQEAVDWLEIQGIEE